jgi:hypothetical protein
MYSLKKLFILILIIIINFYIIFIIFNNLHSSYKDLIFREFQPKNIKKLLEVKGLEKQILIKMIHLLIFAK